MRKEKIIFVLMILVIPLINSDTFGVSMSSNNNTQFGVDMPSPSETTFNNNTGSVNSSNFWDLLDTPLDITFNSMWNRSGTNVFLSNSGDNVGIGTTSPSSVIHMANIDPTFRMQDTDAGFTWFLNPIDGDTFEISLLGSGGSEFLVKSPTALASGTEVNIGKDVKINSSGESFLHGGGLRVNGSLRLINDNQKLFLGASDDISHVFDGSSYNITQEVGSNKFNLIGFSNYTLDSALILNSTAFGLAGGLLFGDSDTGIYQSADDTFKLQVGGNDVISIPANGRVSIISPSPPSITTDYIQMNSFATIAGLRSIPTAGNILTITALTTRINGDAGGQGYPFNIITGTTGVLALKGNESASDVIGIYNRTGTKTMGVTLAGFTQAGAGNGIANFEFRHTVAPSPSDGDGVGIELNTEDNSGVVGDIAKIEAVYDDISLDNVSLRFSVGEDNAGKLKEWMRIDNNGKLNISNLSTEPSTATSYYVCIETDGHVFINETGCRL